MCRKNTLGFDSTSIFNVTPSTRRFVVSEEDIVWTLFVPDNKVEFLFMPETAPKKSLAEFWLSFSKPQDADVATIVVRGVTCYVKVTNTSWGGGMDVYVEALGGTMREFLEDCARGWGGDEEERTDSRLQRNARELHEDFVRKRMGQETGVVTIDLDPTHRPAGAGRFLKPLLLHLCLPVGMLIPW